MKAISTLTVETHAPVAFKIRFRMAKFQPRKFLVLSMEKTNEAFAKNNLKTMHSTRRISQGSSVRFINSKDHLSLRSNTE